MAEKVETEEQLEALLARPYESTVELMRRLDGGIMILGVAGKMGPSLARLALEACNEAQVAKRVVGVSRFSDKEQRRALERIGVETMYCDLSNPAEVEKLPKLPNVIFMAGQKFGTVGSEPLLWIMNTVVPHNVARAFPSSRIVVFSTGCVYPLVPSGAAGCREADPVGPVGEYASSCVGRERIFQYYCDSNSTRVLLYRLNYAVEPRYGVLTDIAQCVSSGTPVDQSVSAFNAIWQGDANNRALLSLGHATCPPTTLNITGTETLRVQDIANGFARRFGTEPKFTGTDSGVAYLSDASRSVEMFGPPKVSLEQAMDWIAEWIMSGQRTLGKPTHFSVTDGQFLDETEKEKPE